MPEHLETVDVRTIGENRLAAIDSKQHHRMSTVCSDIDHLTQDAANATRAEHSMTLTECCKIYPKAIFWSVLISTSIVMVGFDMILMSNFYAYKPFQQKFGRLQPDGTYQLTAAWQAGLASGMISGEILGLFFTGVISEKYGYRKTIIGALAMVVFFIFIPFFSTSIVHLLIGNILLGLPWGVFQTVTCTYAAEVAPVVLRSYVTTYVNLCWVFGQLIASGVLRGMVTRNDDWGYRIPFALQWIWPIPIAIGVACAPESPWWLIRIGRTDDAKKALLRLTSAEKHDKFDANETIAMMEHTNALEKATSEGTSYWDCFRGTDLRRTEIVCCTWAIQSLCGASFMGYSTYFYEQAGLATVNAFTLTMVQFSIGALGAFSTWFLMKWFGRRTLYLAGQAMMIVVLLIIGFLGLNSHNNQATQWAIGSMLLIYTFAYDSTVGPICYSLVTEISSNRLRAKSVVLARNLFNCCSIITNIITPRMLNPSAWNWGAKSGFFWAGSCCLCLIWTWFRLPEPKGRTFAEIDILFEQQVPASKFKSTVVDPFLTKSARRASVSALDESLNELSSKIDDKSHRFD